MTQSNASRWQGEHWAEFVVDLEAQGIEVRQSKAVCGVYITDAGGLGYGLPHGVVVARNVEQIAALMKSAQQFAVPVTVRGGGLTTEGESVAYGGMLLDMTGMSRVLHIDKEQRTVRTQAGIFWHHLAEVLRREALDYVSAPLNLTSSVGGTLGVGGIDVNSSKHGCSADQALALLVVTPTGEIVECSDTQNSTLFARVILGYGQFGIIVEATMRIRPYTPLRMHYFYYSSLKPCVEDLIMLDKSQTCDYTGILTMMDSAITLLVAFDSDEREAAFFAEQKKNLRGYGEFGFAVRLAVSFSWRPWKWREALFLLRRKRELFP
ncbi:MAG: FAD-binding oxidoreductase, partial [Mariprofundaceae bacterium]|nr:FAD-binding oxidoreductase [Mariprofundaceae bacterium]